MVVHRSQSSWFDAVDDAIGRLGEASGMHDGGEPVGDVHDFVADLASLDVSRPPGSTRCSEVSFTAGEVGAFPVSGGTSPGDYFFRAVVAREDGHGVVRNVELVQQVE